MKVTMCDDFGREPVKCNIHNMSLKERCSFAFHVDIVQYALAVSSIATRFFDLYTPSVVV